MSPRSYRPANPGSVRPKCVSPSLEMYKARSERRKTERAKKSVRMRNNLVAMVTIIAIVMAWPFYGETLVSIVRPASKVVDEDALRLEISRVASRYTGTFGIYVKVLETGEEISVNDGEYVAASCYKLPLALLTYRLAADGKLDLDAKIAYTREDWEGGTGVLQATRAGTEFTVRRLVQLAVVESDNIAANMLMRKIGKQALADFHKASGAKVVPLDRNISSPSDMGMFAEHLVSFARKMPGFGHELLAHFLDSRHKDRLALNLPDDVDIANKIGTWPGTVNDVGVVIGEKVSYVVALMSKDVHSTDIGTKALGEISLTIYEHIAERSSSKLRRMSIGRRLLAEMDG